MNNNLEIPVAQPISQATIQYNNDGNTYIDINNITIAEEITYPVSILSYNNNIEVEYRKAFKKIIIKIIKFLFTLFLLYIVASIFLA